MKKITLFLVLAMLFTLGNAPLRHPASEIILTANQVTGARDIEMAIEAATNYGAHPGTVTLDSSKGDFIYTADDRSINIYYSDVTLRGLNGAVIANCADGVFFDDLTANNVTITGITFICEACGVVANNYGQHRNVVVHNNAFYTGGFAIEVLQGDGWRITDNRAVTPSNAINLYETGNAHIRNNMLAGFIGIHLYYSSYENVVLNNRITAQWQGILLSGTTNGNEISANKIANAEMAGIAFGDFVTGNRVTGNQVTCKPGFDCMAVDAYGLNLDQNTIEGNPLLKNP